MPMPDGFKGISPMPWRHEEADQYPIDPTDPDDDGYRGDRVNRVLHAGYPDGRWNGDVCNDVEYYPASVSPDDQKLIARAPDIALLLAAIVKGAARYWTCSATSHIIVECEHVGRPDFFDTTLDPFGCPILSDDCRAAIISALEATP